LGENEFKNYWSPVKKTLARARGGVQSSEKGTSPRKKVRKPEEVFVLRLN